MGIITLENKVLIPNEAEKAHSDFWNFAPEFIPRKPHTCLEGDKTIIFIAALHVTAKTGNISEVYLQEMNK